MPDLLTVLRKANSYPITGSITMDTENASVKKPTINGQEALFSSNSHANILVWHDEEFSYTLSGTIAEKEIVK